VEPDLYQERYPTKFGLVSDEKDKISRKQKISRLTAEMGILKLIPYAIGSFLKKTGQRLQDWVNTPKFLVF